MASLPGSKRNDSVTAVIPELTGTIKVTFVASARVASSPAAAINRSKVLNWPCEFAFANWSPSSKSKKTNCGSNTLFTTCANPFVALISGGGRT